MPKITALKIALTLKINLYQGNSQLVGSRCNAQLENPDDTLTMGNEMVQTQPESFESGKIGENHNQGKGHIGGGIAHFSHLLSHENLVRNVVEGADQTACDCGK